MQDATRISDKTFADTEELMEKQKALQTAYISNENHVKKAQTVAEGAKSLASKANSDLYALNSKFRTVSESRPEGGQDWIGKRPSTWSAAKSKQALQFCFTETG